jgi:hypothetical protein
VSEWDSSKPGVGISITSPPWGGPGGYFRADNLWFSVGGQWRPVLGVWYSSGGAWKSTYSPAPVAPTALSLRVCRDVRESVNDPPKTTWTARALWSRSVADASRAAVIEWYVNVNASTYELVATRNVGTANSDTLAFTNGVGDTRQLYFRVRILAGLGVESPRTQSPVRTADHANLDPFCPIDPI